MQRLIAFGCSNTYGEGLEDRITTKFDSLKEPASEFAWPKVLGNLLGLRTVINCAEPGSSNKHIWNRAINFDYQSDDIVFVHWTFLDRDCVFEKHNKIGPWQSISKDRNKKQEKLIANYYYKYFYSQKDRLLDLCIRADHLDRYLQEKDIRHYNLLTIGNSYGGDSQGSLDMNFPNWSKTRFLKTSFVNTPRLDEALDGDHAGIKTHASVAQHIYKEIKSS